MGAGGMTSDQISSVIANGSESPMPLVATTEMRTELDGPLPGVGIVQVVPGQSCAEMSVPDGVSTLTR